MNNYKLHKRCAFQLLSLVLIVNFGCATKALSPTVDSEFDKDEIAQERPNLDSGLVSRDYNLLFVGNSLTYTNDLPKLVKMEGEKKGISLSVHSISKPNYAIVDHWSDGEVQNQIRTGKYDFVIIQQGPSSQADGYDMLVNDGKKYANICKANGSKLAYFMVWPAWYNYQTFDRVIENYSSGAKVNDAILCPVGLVWKRYFDRTGDFSYYGPDGFHPSKKGSQVAAEVIVDSLFK
ncbi:SGNH/GDSL hydrolase family protein [Flagellimonas sp.]|uniref:SGNH/GDSL hydrolase family protein n=1 Tax=Flagellimonas sp. TaxID=2058762 RepID=UPI003F4A2B11